VSFLTPLAAGLLVLVPILVVFYLLKVRRLDYEVGSTFLWRHLTRDVTAHEPWQRLRWNPLLLLQALVMLAIIIALMRPYLARAGAATSFEVVVLDGKALRGSQGTQLVGAINARSGRTLGVEAVADKSNEIPAGQTLLERLDLEGTIALMDALHTQVRTAREVVQEKGGHYVLVAKGNQETLLNQAKTFLPEGFSPSGVQRESRARTH